MGCDLNLGEDQRQIRDAAAAMLALAYPLSRKRGGGPDDVSALSEFGAFALALPEAQGGAGFTLVEEVLLHGLLGRHCLGPRALGGALGARIAAAAGDDARAADIAAARAVVGVAVPWEGGQLLIDCSGADLALVFTGSGLQLLDLAGGPGEEVRGLGQGWIDTRRLGPGAAPILTETDDADLVALADLLVAAQLLGVAEAARDLTVGYAGIRTQFGRPIGAFQAIKHRCADMAIGAEMLSAQLDMAALTLRARAPDAAFQVAAARRLAPRIALANARACIQLHGGIGFSDEADAHHFLKQAHVLARLGAPGPILDLPAPLAPLRRA